MINVTGLWKNVSKDKKEYLSGTMGGVRVLIFKNENKKTDKSPDYSMVYTENKKQEKKADVPEEQPEFPDTSMPF